MVARECAMEMVESDPGFLRPENHCIKKQLDENNALQSNWSKIS
jgi:hypothetical protein